MVNKHYGCPTSYPKLDKQLIKACTYRVAASVAPGPGSSVAFTNTEAHYLLVEQQFCGLGLERSTAEVYERLIRSNKDRVGEVWLDGKSVSGFYFATDSSPLDLPLHLLLPQALP